MKLVFLYHPVDNLMESLSYYRDTLGFEEAWREGEQAIALQLPGTDVKLLIENDEHDLGAGGVFLVESVDDFFQEKKDTLTFVREPVDIPPGRYAIYKDGSGNVIRIIDFTNE
ncbi:hypothetical protein AC622_11100 [Bacillus sp. FJAT-27916]|uniref:VOC family protein n=1 Tax=Bacillus sp. FJAT-27916 TaxID=1679169 RepID=UPI0006707D12|nr:VOC family protein [Bacillus sp. FJAT-27916]KMY44707.1 hypothetical protein AC622_11100 [Bacillus sp. FJAT-27916]